MTATEFAKLRRGSKLTQAQAGRLIGVTETAVRHWERGRRAVPQYAVNMLNLAMAASAEQLETLLAARRG